MLKKIKKERGNDDDDDETVWCLKIDKILTRIKIHVSSIF